MSKGSGWVSVVALVCAIVSPAGAAVMIPILNPGFEADPAGDGEFVVLTQVTDWTAFDPNGLLPLSGNNAIGVINPTGSDFFPAGAPEGDNAALVYIEDNIGDGPVGLTQELTDVLEANTRYTLTVEVGNIASGTSTGGVPFHLDGFPGYAVQLLAGGVIIDEDLNTLAGSIPEGEFALSTVDVTILPGHPQIGELLEVRVINLNMEDSQDDPGIEVDFDDVQLTATTVPEPGAGAVMLAAVVSGLGVRARRRGCRA